MLGLTADIGCGDSGGTIITMRLWVCSIGCESKSHLEGTCLNTPQSALVPIGTDTASIVRCSNPSNASLNQKLVF